MDEMERLERRIEALDYGAFKGLGQWRNGQNGRFMWEVVKEES